MFYIVLTLLLVLFVNYFKTILKLIKSLFFKSKSNLVFDLKDYQYEPTNYEACAQLVESIKKKLIEIGYDKSPMIRNNEKIINHLKTVLERADKSCCGLIKANGYFSLAKLSFKYLDVVNNKLMSNELKSKEKNQKPDGETVKDFIKSFTIFSDLLLNMLDNASQIMEETNLDDEQKVKKLENELLKYPEFFRNQKIYRSMPVTRLASDYEKLKRDDPIDESEASSYGLYSAISNLVSYDNDTVNTTFSNTVEGKQFNSLPLFSPNLSMTCDQSYEMIHQENTKHKEVIFQKHFLFWIDKALVSFLRPYSTVMPFLRAHLSEYPKLISNGEYWAQYLNKIISMPTINFPFEVWNGGSYKLSQQFIERKTKNLNAKTREIFLPSQKTIEINESPADRLKINNSNRIVFDNLCPIRCKIVEPKDVDLKDCDKLLIHIHGGAFFSQTADSSHMIYLKYWVDFNKIPIITIDYRIKCRSPLGLQDCFDVYLWLREAPEEEVRSILGFYPNKLIITGESSGAKEAMSIPLILNDLKTDYKSKFNVQIAFPDGLFLIYCPFLIHTSLCVSRQTSSLDVMVPMGILLLILYGLQGHIPNLRPNTTYETILMYLFPDRDPKPFFDCSREKFNDYIKLLATEPNSPYLSPLFYDKYENFPEIPIHLISAEYCPLLDESVTFAKIYKGPLKIDVLPDQCHGFLALEFGKHDAKSGKMFCAHKLTEMFKEIDLKHPKIICLD